MKAFKPLNNKNMSEQVAERIYRMIESGELKPGDKLPSEPEFAQQLGISRGILREGLAQLKVQGIVSRKPKDGTYIRSQSIDGNTMTDGVLHAIEAASYRNVLEMRDAIEQKAVVLVIERATDEELDELMDMVLATPQAEPEDDVDYYFHYRLVELSQNTIFMHIVNAYFDEIREIRNRNLTDTERRAKVFEEHLALASAMRRRDKEAALEAVRHHMDMVGRKLMTRTDAPEE